MPPGAQRAQFGIACTHPIVGAIGVFSELGAAVRQIARVLLKTSVHVPSTFWHPRAEDSRVGRAGPLAGVSAALQNFRVMGANFL